MRQGIGRGLRVAWVVLLLMQTQRGETTEGVFPTTTWQTRTPEHVGLNTHKLAALQQHVRGRGCIVRHGYLVYVWGDPTKRGDVASAVKPWYSHFVFRAVEKGRLADLDAHVSGFVPCLNEINAHLEHKDRAITFRHLANQTSCYGVTEAPGTAFDYNDWQMALFFDALFLGVYGATYENLDESVLHPELTRLLECEDTPTFTAFGTGDRPGRLAVSPRDFARFGLLYLHEGRWRGRQILARRFARMAVTSSLPASLPRTSGEEAEMCPGQRSIGSRSIPDNQCDHRGSYSWLWWVNGIDRHGTRHWPDAPVDTYAALGHGGMRGMAVLPSLDLVISWNDAEIHEKPDEPDPLNEAFRLLVGAASQDDP